jgi:hypothetical protein
MAKPCLVCRVRGCFVLESMPERIVRVECNAHKTAVPAKAGTHASMSEQVDEWIPGFAGMTGLFSERNRSERGQRE